MIENIEQLLTIANSIPGEYDRIRYVLNYFLETVEYDYAYMLGAGTMRGSISGIAKSNSLTKNPFSVGKRKLLCNGENRYFNDEYCMERKVLAGESELFNKIVAEKNNCFGNFELFLSRVKEILFEKLKKSLKNEVLIEKEVNILVEKIKKNMLNEFQLRKTSRGEEFIIYNDISYVLINYMIDSGFNSGMKYFPPVIENGILKRGVCEHYSKYLLDLFSKLGIEAHLVNGTSVLDHAWIIVKLEDEYKSIDLTRAIMIRDGNIGIPDDQKSEDWLISDISSIFEMQPTRTITKIDGKELSYVINRENFNYEDFKLMIKEGIK